MDKVGAGALIYDLRKKIQDMQSEFDSIGSFEASPELIESANLLRSNEHLSKTVRIQADLVQAYREYSEALESLLSTVFEIQADLKDVLKEQSLLLSETKPKKRTKASKTSIKRGQRHRP